MGNGQEMHEFEGFYRQENMLLEGKRGLEERRRGYRAVVNTWCSLENPIFLISLGAGHISTRYLQDFHQSKAFILAL